MFVNKICYQSKKSVLIKARPVKDLKKKLKIFKVCEGMKSNKL